MIDGHCHLDKKLGSVENAFKFLFDEAKNIGIKEIILINIPEINFENSEVLNFANNYNNFFHVFPTINPFNKKAKYLVESYKNAGAKGIKLHPRIHKFKIECVECIELLKCAGDLKLPVLIDYFPADKNIILGNSSASFGKIAEQAPHTKIAIGHAGGHHILDSMMVAKYYKNIFLDLSLTLLYYRTSHIIKDIEYVLNSMKYERIFWGTDYPDRPYSQSVQLSLYEFEQMNLQERGKKLLLKHNVISFLDS